MDFWRSNDDIPEHATKGTKLGVRNDTSAALQMVHVSTEWDFSSGQTDVDRILGSTCALPFRDEWTIVVPLRRYGRQGVPTRSCVKDLTRIVEKRIDDRSAT